MGMWNMCVCSAREEGREEGWGVRGGVATPGKEGLWAGVADLGTLGLMRILHVRVVHVVPDNAIHIDGNAEVWPFGSCDLCYIA